MGRLLVMSIKRQILLIGDVVEDRKHIDLDSMFDADNPSEEEIYQVQEWIECLGYSVRVVRSIKEYATGSWDPEKCLAFPLWRGGASRNRTAIVPAVSEELGIPCVGGDAYVHSICQDKELPD